MKIYLNNCFVNIAKYFAFLKAILKFNLLFKKLDAFKVYFIKHTNPIPEYSRYFRYSSIHKSKSSIKIYKTKVPGHPDLEIPARQALFIATNSSWCCFKPPARLSCWEGGGLEAWHCSKKNAFA